MQKILEDDMRMLAEKSAFLEQRLEVLERGAARRGESPGASSIEQGEGDREE